VPTAVTPAPLVRIWFDAEWLLQNDKNPDPYYVLITFPERWIETGKSDSYNGTGGAKLQITKKLLLDANESTNPDEITVNFPAYYFNSLP
jgi:hypothetical protein